MRFVAVTCLQVFKSIIFTIGAAMVLSFVFYTFYFMVAPALKFFWPHLEFITDNSITVGYCIWTLVLVIFMLVWGFEYFSKYSAILSTALEDYREKKCTRIEFKD